GEQVQQGVLLPHFLAIPIRRPSPQVDDRLAGDLHAEGGAPLAGVVEQGGEGVAHRFETQVEETVDLHTGSWRRWGARIVVAAGLRRQARGVRTVRRPPAAIPGRPPPAAASAAAGAGWPGARRRRNRRTARR